MERTIILTDGSVVTVNASLSVGAMRRFRQQDLLTKEMLSAIVNGTKGLDILDMLDLAGDAVYVAYVNANPEPAYSKDEFLELLPNDMDVNIEIYGTIIGGKNVGNQFSQGFNSATKKSKGKTTANPKNTNRNGR